MSSSAMSKTSEKAPKKASTVSLATATNKTFDLITSSIVTEIHNKLVSDGDFEDEVNMLITEKLDEYKKNIKASLKATKKKQKSLENKDKPKRAPTKYNIYQKLQTAYYKENNPEIANNDRFARIAKEWKNVKATWEIPSNVDKVTGKISEDSKDNEDNEDNEDNKDNEDNEDNEDIDNNEDSENNEESENEDN